MVERSNRQVTMLSWMRQHEGPDSTGLELEALIIHAVLQDALGSDVGAVRTQSIVETLRERMKDKGELPYTVVSSRLYESVMETRWVMATNSTEAERSVRDDREETGTIVVFEGHHKPQ